MERDVVIGVDAGGTSTRCVAVGLDGRVLSRGSAGGANPFSSPDPAGALEAALGQAVGGVGAGRVAAAVFGIAGASAAGHARASEAAGRAWRAAGLPGAPRVTDDIAVAFAAGTHEPEGAVVIAGTGAVAAHVADGSVRRRCDGYGWLLGDEGSAVWIALAGLRAALAGIDGRGGATVLSDRMAAALEIAPGDPQEFILTVYPRPPAELGGQAPEVTGAAREGDAEAARICDEAAGRLLDALGTVLPPGSGRPVVLAGALMGAGPVAERVRAGIGERFGSTPLAAADGVLGAAGLALRDAGAPPDAHARVLSGRR
ncbi:N-acetylglucosamine kinase [Nocardiopsis sp. RSe5-2]|uniref:N-acetylglucosamine kinase n=1 Tax=Nocardiopsis endophytica TaxID=3018445 RepID=A0ABT4UCB8_9ACTN|nr:BadF/BadG/BcrA/BcrD ATPase family protein [Nocardiopsis endophytica]MDA2814616.1 N-acetylglucosamine kinase [Nocardiopsis endophytica]